MFLENAGSMPESVEHIGFSKEYHCFRQFNIPFSIPCHFTFHPTFKCNIFSVEWFLDITIHSLEDTELIKVLSPLTATVQYKNKDIDSSNTRITNCRVPIILESYYSSCSFQIEN